MNFWIQCCNPVFSVEYSSGHVVEDLAEAIQEIFPMKTEDAFIVWNRICIPVGYKYDLSVLIDDILPMCSKLLTQSNGEYSVWFGSDTFNAKWHLSWSDNLLSVTADWNSAVGDLEVVKDNCSELEITVEGFLSEWKGILYQLIKALSVNEITMEDTSSYDLLKEVESKISTFGYLYEV